MLQSERPRVSTKEATEGRLQDQPPDSRGLPVSPQKSKDDRIAARLGSQPEEGVGTGYYNAFLHQWAENVAAIYQPTVPLGSCRPSFAAGYNNGHITELEPITSCGAADDAFRRAIERAARPPMPTTFANRHLVIQFLDTRRADDR